MKGCIYLPLKFLNVWVVGHLLLLSPEAAQVLQELLKHITCGELYVAIIHSKTLKKWLSEVLVFIASWKDKCNLLNVS